MIKLTAILILLSQSIYADTPLKYFETVGWMTRTMIPIKLTAPTRSPISPI